MSDFLVFKGAVQEQVKNMSTYHLFTVDIGRDELWDKYLKSFPKGSNPLFRERTEHDCQCCKQFIRNFGHLVAINEQNKLISIWDIKETTNKAYNEVAKALSKLVKSKPVKNIFLHYEDTLGTDCNYDGDMSGGTLKWDHFYSENPIPKTRKDEIGTELSHSESSFAVFKRGLSEISTESLEVTLELIEQNSLYKGEEYYDQIGEFLSVKKRFLKLKQNQDNFVWKQYRDTKSISRLRNTAIGTLLLDISEGRELDEAVRAFETMVAPTNYKRSTAIVSKAMIERAEIKIDELGITDSLERRHACVADITVNNILYADRSTKKQMNVFDKMKKDVKVDIKESKNIQNVSIDDFIKDILPKTKSLELLPENKHTSNLMSLVAPVEPKSKHIFKWDNNFSWAYKGDVTDSIKERVKKAGGNVEGVLRCSLSWFNVDDLDIHVIEPNGNNIEYGNKGFTHPSTGILDVDMNAGNDHSRTPVENITWSDESKMIEGVYQLFVNQYTKRENTDVGFIMEVEYKGNVLTFEYDKQTESSKNVQVLTFEYSHKNGIKVIKSLPSASTQKEEWSIKTNTMNKVSMVMKSPNHWDGNETGNKHWFFILEGCKNDKPVRGFFNEYLTNDLNEHRKVIEVLGSKTKAAYSDNQLSGLGFSSTIRNSILCKVSGAFSRIIRINF